MTTTPTPVERAVDVLHQHIQTTIATIAAGLPSDRALRDVTGVTASCEQAVLGEVTQGGPLTRQGLDIAVRRALSAALDGDDGGDAHVEVIHDVVCDGRSMEDCDGVCGEVFAALRTSILGSTR